MIIPIRHGEVNLPTCTMTNFAWNNDKTETGHITHETVLIRNSQHIQVIWLSTPIKIVML